MRGGLAANRLARLGFLVVVALVGAACSAGKTTTTSETTLAVPVANRVRCSGVIDTFEDAPEWEGFATLLDSVVLQSTPLESGREGEPGTPYEGLRFAKFGLVVRADRALTLEILDVRPGRALLEWGPLEDPGRPATRLEVGPCPGEGSAWIVFAGGLWASESPSCVTLAVTDEGGSELARIGIDAPCPG